MKSISFCTSILLLTTISVACAQTPSELPPPDITVLKAPGVTIVAPDEIEKISTPIINQSNSAAIEDNINNNAEVAVDSEAEAVEVAISTVEDANGVTYLRNTEGALYLELLHTNSDTWVQAIQAPDYNSVALHFSQFQLLPDDTLVISDAFGNELLTYTLAELEQLQADEFWTPALPPKFLKIELFTSINTDEELENYGAIIDSFRGDFDLDTSQVDTTEYSLSPVDIVVEEGVFAPEATEELPITENSNQDIAQERLLDAEPISEDLDASDEVLYPYELFTDDVPVVAIEPTVESFVEIDIDADLDLELPPEWKNTDVEDIDDSIADFADPEPPPWAKAADEDGS